jgi:hypothetical protein
VTTPAPGASSVGLPDYAPVPSPRSAGPSTIRGYYVGRVEQNLYWVTDGSTERTRGQR